MSNQLEEWIFSPLKSKWVAHIGHVICFQFTNPLIVTRFMLTLVIFTQLKERCHNCYWCLSFSILTTKHLGRCGVIFHTKKSTQIWSFWLPGLFFYFFWLQTFWFFIGKLLWLITFQFLIVHFWQEITRLELEVASQ